MTQEDEVWRRAVALTVALRLDPPAASEGTPICNRMRAMGWRTDHDAETIDGWVYRVVAKVRHHKKPFTRALVEATRRRA